VDPLVRARGAELGLRSLALRHVHATLSLWTLDLDSELLYVGDAGTTEASRPSRRRGVEWSFDYVPRPWLSLDASVAWSRARFTDGDPAGDRIPAAVEGVASAGLAVHGLRGWLGSLRWRYFGPRPLIEDDSVRSDPAHLVTAQLGYAFGERVTLKLDVFNLFDAAISDVDYFYASRLPGEPDQGVPDVHFHPMEPRTLRLGLSWRF
jgi:outer membrane receptor protein involved in Fe transport